MPGFLTDAEVTAPGVKAFQEATKKATTPTELREAEMSFLQPEKLPKPYTRAPEVTGLGTLCVMLVFDNPAKIEQWKRMFVTRTGGGMYSTRCNEKFYAMMDAAEGKTEGEEFSE